MEQCCPVIFYTKAGFIMGDVVLTKSQLRALKHISQSEVERVIKDDTLQQMIKEGQTLFNRVNKRIRNIERNRQIISPAYNALVAKRGSAPRFGTSGTYSNLNELQKEIARAQEYDNMETSTVQGARNFTNNLRKQLHTKRGEKLSDEFISQIFDALHSLHERMPDVLYKNQLQYADYLDSIVETAENVDLSKLDSAEQVETLVTQAIEKLSAQITSKINDDIDTLRNSFNRLY